MPLSQCTRHRLNKSHCCPPQPSPLGHKMDAWSEFPPGNRPSPGPALTTSSPHLLSVGVCPCPRSPPSLRRNPDAWSDYPPGNGIGHLHAPYTFTQPVFADPELVWSLAAEAGLIMGPANVVRGLNATADSFYSSQVGRRRSSEDAWETLAPSGEGGSRGGGGRAEGEGVSVALHGTVRGRDRDAAPRTNASC